MKNSGLYKFFWVFKVSSDTEDEDETQDMTPVTSPQQLIGTTSPASPETLVGMFVEIENYGPFFSNVGFA